MLEFKSHWERLQIIIDSRGIMRPSVSALVKELGIGFKTFYKLKNGDRLAYKTHLQIEEWLEEQERNMHRKSKPAVLE